MSKLAVLLKIIGVLLLVAAFALFSLIFYPIARQEVNYQFSTNSSNAIIVPVDKDFGIVIPKIRANAKVVANVDPFNKSAYQRALTGGVAHAKGTSLPDQDGNVFIFSHSSVNFYEASRYNSIFYLLSKMETGDEIDLYFEGQKYVYEVDVKKIVAANSVEYLKGNSSGPTLTLMTCWPPGTTYKRLLIIATLEK